ncbi:MAG: hypothetical protein NT034_00370 [Candidatus Magasanikbacteria bacterium]|nr:hypothetical protein [Candidatus Magasanikbacteria bacterium]
MKINLSIEKRTILVLTLFFLSTVIIIMAIIFPTINFIKNLSDDTGNLRKYLDDKYEANHSLLNYKQKIEEDSAAITEYKSYLFFKGEELQLITKLENLAEQYKLNQKINNTDLDKPGNTIHISLTLTGNYANLLQYLLALEKDVYFMQVKSLHLSPGFSTPTDDPQAAILNLDLVLYAAKQ